MNGRMCRRCKSNPRWREGEWCVACTVQACCQHYPKFVGNVVVRCVHGDAAIKDLAKRNR